MKKGQIVAILAHTGNPKYIVNKWFVPSNFAYVVLKDNSILYIANSDMWYFDNTDEILYVANAQYDKTNKTLKMPDTGVTSTDNIDRLSSIILYSNINHIVMRHQGEYLSGGRSW